MTKYVDRTYPETEECCNCGMTFAMTQDFKRRRLKDRGWFYCPAGHGQHYTGKSDAQKERERANKLERQLEAEKGRSLMIENERNQVEKKYKRVRERIKNGVCPCCNRTFTNLAKHMKTKHPEFGEHETLKAIRTAYGLTQTALAEEIGIISSVHVLNYENEKHLPEYAKTMVGSWFEANA